MAGETRKLTVSLSSEAIHTLGEIWLWNAQNHGEEHADRYAAFLMAEITKLETAFFLGKSVPKSSRLNYIVIQRRAKGHGHLAVYDVVGNFIRVLQLYHTAEDWPTKVAKQLK